MLWAVPETPQGQGKGGFLSEIHEKGEGTCGTTTDGTIPGSWGDWRGDARCSFPWGHPFAAPDAAQIPAPKDHIKIITSDLTTNPLGDTKCSHRGDTRPEEQQCLENQLWVHPGPAMGRGLGSQDQVGFWS